MNRSVLVLLVSFFSFAEIKFDGLVGDSEWSDAEVYDLPFEISPSYNTDAEHETFVYIKNDASNLYVAFKALGNKNFIRAGVRARDGINWLDDQVAVGIDTFGDGRYYIRFSANPLGSIGTSISTSIVTSSSTSASTKN